MIRASSAIAWLLTAFLLAACQRSPRLESFDGRAQGTSYHIVYWLATPGDRQALQRAVDTELQRLDRLLSNYRNDSTIERFNADRSSAAIEVGPEIVALVEQARFIASAVDGCYDPSIKPAFDLWGFRGDHLSPPTAAQLAAVMTTVGIDKVIRVDASHLQKTEPRLQLDLASIGQGYSLSRLGQVLEAAGSANYVIELGGEMQIRGRRPDGSGWRVAIERPLPGRRHLSKVLRIASSAPTALMSSGTYRHYFDAAGHRFSHILDARNGAPVTHDTVAVSLLYDDASAADAWSTALLCLGSERGLAVAEQHQLAVLFVDQTGDDLRESSSRAWQARAHSSGLGAE